jgi:hypothetical protein
MAHARAGTRLAVAAAIAALGLLGLLGGLVARGWFGRRSRGAPRRALSRRAPGPVTQSLVPVNPADTPLGEPGHNLDQRLDEALQETFPGSDPIATHIE